MRERGAGGRLDRRCVSPWLRRIEVQAEKRHADKLIDASYQHRERSADRHQPTIARDASSAQFVIIIGIGPRTIPDVVYHVAIVAVLIYGLLMASRMSSARRARE